VEGDELSVAGPPHVELDHVGPDADRVVEGVDGVLRRAGGEPAVRGDHGTGHTPKYARPR